MSLLLVPAGAFSCDQISSGQAIWVRLTAPLSTYTAKPGDEVQGVLTDAMKCDGDTDFPVGTHVSGTVHAVRKVGWGVRHETADLDIRFNELHPADAPAVAFSATLTEVENARERVSKGVIQGVRSSDTPEGRINSRLKHLPTLNPYSDLGLIVYKAAFPIFPEPEIYLPAGTDLRLRLDKPIIVPAPHAQAAGNDAANAAANAAADFEWQQYSRSLPIRCSTPANVDADLINLAFVGSQEQIETAFQNAGWVVGNAVTKQSFAHTFYAYLNNSGYTQAPMKPFVLNGNPADMNWQKSLNSYARRDHLRIWKWTDSSSGQTVWLSASTHDSSAGLSLKHHQFLHHISPNIDEERSKVIRDLSAAGCVQSVHMVQRPGVPTFTQNSIGDPMRTDGSLAVVELKACQSSTPELASVSTPAPYKPGNKVFRYFRRQILTFRSDIWRANIIYGAYDLGRMSVAALRKNNTISNAAF